MVRVYECCAFAHSNGRTVEPFGGPSANRAGPSTESETAVALAVVQDTETKLRAAPAGHRSDAGAPNETIACAGPAGPDAAGWLGAGPEPAGVAA